MYFVFKHKCMFYSLRTKKNILAHFTYHILVFKHSTVLLMLSRSSQWLIRYRLWVFFFWANHLSHKCDELLWATILRQKESHWQNINSNQMKYLQFVVCKNIIVIFTAPQILWYFLYDAYFKEYYGITIIEERWHDHNFMSKNMKPWYFFVRLISRIASCLKRFYFL